MHDWNQIARQLEGIEHQDNTHILVQKLSHPLEEIFDMSKPYVVKQVDQNRMP